MLILMLLELPAVMIGIGVAAKGRTQEPFCNASNSWVKFKKLGYVPSQVANEFLQALANGDYYTARQNIQSKGTASHLEISIVSCQSLGYLRIATKEVKTDAEGTHNVSLEAVQILNVA